MIQKLPSIDLPRERFVLECGATLLVSRRPDAPVCALQIHIRGGHSLDPEGREGTAHLSGALIDQGTRSKSEEQIAELLEPSAGVLSGDASGLGGQVVARDWKLLVELACELITEPTYPQAQIERQKERLLERLLVERDDPRAQGEQLFRRLVYGSHWLGRTTYGTIASVKKIRRGDLIAFQKTNWVAKRAIIAVCGDVDPREVKALFEKRLARWAPGDDFAPPAPTFPDRRVRVDVFRAERAQVHVYLGHLGIARSNPDYVPLAVMDHVLGTGPGFTNRIAMRLRDELGLAYTVSASIHSSAGVLPGTFRAYIGTSPQNVRAAIEGFLREIRRIRDEKVGDAELETAKSYLVGAWAIGFQPAAVRAGFLIAMERHKFPDDILVQLPRWYAEVTPDDVQRAARAHLHPESCCIAASGPIAKRELESIASASGLVAAKRA